MLVRPVRRDGRRHIFARDWVCRMPGKLIPCVKVTIQCHRSSHKLTYPGVREETDFIHNLNQVQFDKQNHLTISNNLVVRQNAGVCMFCLRRHSITVLMLFVYVDHVQVFHINVIEISVTVGCVYSFEQFTHIEPFCKHTMCHKK